MNTKKETSRSALTIRGRGLRRAQRVELAKEPNYCNNEHMLMLVHEVQLDRLGNVLWPMRIGSSMAMLSAATKAYRGEDDDEYRLAVRPYMELPWVASTKEHHQYAQHVYAPSKDALEWVVAPNVWNDVASLTKHNGFRDRSDEELYQLAYISIVVAAFFEYHFGEEGGQFKLTADYAAELAGRVGFDSYAEVVEAAHSKLVALSENTKLAMHVELNKLLADMSVVANDQESFAWVRELPETELCTVIDTNDDGNYFIDFIEHVVGI